jgi:hypothetical protein
MAEYIKFNKRFFSIILFLAIRASKLLEGFFADTFHSYPMKGKQHNEALSVAFANLEELQTYLRLVDENPQNIKTNNEFLDGDILKLYNILDEYIVASKKLEQALQMLSK